MLNIIADKCNHLLSNFPDASDVAYYLDNRLSKDTQNKFNLGYFPNSSNINVLIREVGDNPLWEADLLRKFEIDDSVSPREIIRPYFEHHPLVIPYKDIYGRIVGLMSRTLLSEEEMKSQRTMKYLNTSFLKGNHLFGIFEAKNSILENDCVYIVEGQFDVMSAHENGMKNIVALGSANMTPYQLAMICRYTKNIFLLLDNDQAGEKGRKLIIDKFGTFANITNFYVSDLYKDLDEYLKDNKGFPTLFLKNNQ